VEASVAEPEAEEAECTPIPFLDELGHAVPIAAASREAPLAVPADDPSRVTQSLDALASAARPEL